MDIAATKIELMRLLLQIEKESVLAKLKVVLEEEDDWGEQLTHSADDKVLDEGMQYLISKSKAFAFLEDEEELYSDEEMIEKYHEKR